MEKIMFFGFALLFEIMTAIPPQAKHRPPTPAPPTGANDIEMKTKIEPGAVYDNAKPVKIYPQAEFWHSME